MRCPSPPCESPAMPASPEPTAATGPDRPPETAAAADEDAQRSCGSCSNREFLGFGFCVLVAIAVGVCILIYGPQDLLRYLLRLVPEKPGWEFAVGLCVLTIVSIVFCLPIWPPLCMATGLFYGVWWGTLLCFCAIFAAANICFLLGRVAFKEPIRNCIEAGNYPRVRRMMLVLEDETNSLKFMVLFRFLLIPMFIRNYGPATLEIPFWTLFVSAIPHSIWISIMFASLGAAFKDAAELIREGKEFEWRAIKWQQMVVFAVALVVSIIACVYAYYEYNNRLAEEDAQKLAEAEAQSPQRAEAQTAADPVVRSGGGALTPAPAPRPAAAPGGGPVDV